MMGEFAALKARLAESPMLAGRVHPIVRVTGGGAVRANYVVAKSSPPDRFRRTYTSPQSLDGPCRYTFDVRVVAVDDDGMMQLSREVVRLLLGYRLSVPGRDCDPLSIVEEVEEGDGYDRTANLFYRDFSFRFWSRRAA